MNRDSNYLYLGVSGLLALFMIGTGLKACAETIEESVWPVMRPLGRDIPAHQDEGEANVQANPPAQEPEGVLTLRRAQELALLHNPELTASFYGVRAATGNARQAGAWSNPNFELNVEEFGGSGTRKGYDAAQTTAQLSQTVEWGGKRSKRKAIAQTEARLSGWDYEAKRLDVLTQTKKAFVDMLLVQGHFQLAESLLGVAEDVRQVAEKRVTAGKVPPLEQTKAGVEVAAARIARDRAKSEWEAARKRLASFWGGTLPVFSEAVGDLDAVRDVPPVEHLVALLDEAPEVARWIEEVALGRKSLALARAERIPDLDVSAGLRRFEEDGTHAAVVGLSMPLPLFNRNTGGILAAKHQATRADYEQRAARSRVTTELIEAHSRLAMARTEALTTREELLPAAQQAFDAAQTGYREGKFGYLEVLDAQRTLGEAKSRYLDVLAAYHKAAAEVERVTAKPLSTIQ